VHAAARAAAACALLAAGLFVPPALATPSGPVLAPGVAVGQVASSPDPRHRRARRVLLQSATLKANRTTATLTLSLSAPVRARLLRLHQPERVVIDLPHTRSNAPLPVSVPSSLIVTVRSGVSSAGDLRLVLGLRSRARASIAARAGRDGRELRLTIARSASAARISAALPATAQAADQAAAAGESNAARGESGGTSGEPSVTQDRSRGIQALHAPQGFHDVVVVVDPGHGGVDPGATGRDGAHEKDLTLAIARALAARIDRAPGMHAVLTRDGDYFISLSERLERARRAHADFFVSIHADSVRDPQISGASVYVLSERGASSEAARRLAAEENAADLRGGISLDAQAQGLRSVLLDLSQSASIGESAEAAEQVLGALEGVGTVRTRAVQRAAFVVLKSPYIPSMLVETAYISNHADEQRLKSPSEQQRLAEAIFQGIADYFRQYPPPGSLFARARELAAPASS
jgi:N-acetylmuramoyl-L-alanine amidase